VLPAVIVIGLVVKALVQAVVVADVLALVRDVTTVVGEEKLLLVL